MAENKSRFSGSIKASALGMEPIDVFQHVLEALAAGGHREPHLRPVVTKVCINLHDFNICEPHRFQRFECRADVRTLLPGAASAIEDDGPVVRNTFHA